jgi:hypothetical protein
VKICKKQTDERLSKSKLCSTQKSIACEALDEQKTNSTEVIINIFLNYIIFNLKIFIILARSKGNLSFQNEKRSKWKN